MKHLDLFSGIGGFAYAARQVWGSEYENVGFCDNDHFCQQVLAKNFPGCIIHADIRTLTNAPGQGLQGGDDKESSGRLRPPEHVDLITGGFPCQPFSSAGKRRGTSDDRHLWPEMLCVIREFKPTWVIGENVGGFVTWNEGMVLEQVCTDLEAEGYEVQPFIIPACAVNAPHRRDRIWITAHRRYAGASGRDEVTQGQQFSDGGFPRGKSASQNSAITDAGRQCRVAGTGKSIRSESQEPGQTNCQYPDWGRDWREVAFATCDDAVDDGLPRRVVRFPDGSTISEAHYRREAIKAYGNSIVPQVAMEIMKTIRII